MIQYGPGQDGLDLETVIERYYLASTLGERRPVDDRGRMAAMVAHANLVVTAWDDTLLVGIARSVSDFAYCTYLSGLAVRLSDPRKGIGRELIRRTREAGGAATNIVLSVPKATGYCQRPGFSAHSSAWVLAADAEVG